MRGEFEQAARKATESAKHAGSVKFKIRDVFIGKNLEISERSAEFTNSADRGNAL